MNNKIIAITNTKPVSVNQLFLLRTFIRFEKDTNPESGILQ